MTLEDALAEVSATYADLQARNERLGCGDLADQDPRDVASALTGLTHILTHRVRSDSDPAPLVRSIAAHCVVFLRACARVEELDVSAGDDLEPAA